MQKNFSDLTLSRLKKKKIQNSWEISANGAKQGFFTILKTQKNHF